MHPVVNVLNILGGKILFGNYNFSLRLKLCPPCQKKFNLDLPDGPVVKTSPFNAEGEGLIPGQGIKVPHVTWCGQKIKTKFCCVKPPSLCTCDSRPGCLIYLSKIRGR